MSDRTATGSPHTSPYLGLFTYPWDVEEVGTAPFLKELRATGLNGVTLTSAYHAGKFVRARGLRSRLIFPEDGTVYFRHHPERYGALKPEANSMLQRQDVMADLCDSGTRVTGWVVLLHNSRLGWAHPEATVKTAFGDGLVNTLCPSNPAVREYGIALCTDLAEGYGLESIILETTGFMPFEHNYHHEGVHLQMNPWLTSLMGLCFCEHCVAGAGKAGIDAEALRSRVAKQLGTFLDSDLVPDEAMGLAWWMADVMGEPDLYAYLRWRCELVAGLVKEIRAAMPSKVLLGAIPTQRRPVSAGWIEGHDLHLLAEAADFLEASFYLNGPEPIRCDAWDLRRRMGADAPIRTVLRPATPDLENAAAVAGAIAAVRSQGYQDLSFYNYGRMRKVNLEWVAAALNG